MTRAPSVPSSARDLPLIPFGVELRLFPAGGLLMVAASSGSAAVARKPAPPLRRGLRPSRSSRIHCHADREAGFRMKSRGTPRSQRPGRKNTPSKPRDPPVKNRPGNARRLARSRAARLASQPHATSPRAFGGGRSDLGRMEHSLRRTPAPQGRAGAAAGRSHGRRPTRSQHGGRFAHSHAYAHTHSDARRLDVGGPNAARSTARGVTLERRPGGRLTSAPRQAGYSSRRTLSSRNLESNLPPE